MLALWEYPRELFFRELANPPLVSSLFRRRLVYSVGSTLHTPVTMQLLSPLSITSRFFGCFQRSPPPHSLQLSSPRNCTLYLHLQTQSTIRSQFRDNSHFLAYITRYQRDPKERKGKRFYRFRRRKKRGGVIWRLTLVNSIRLQIT